LEAIANVATAFFDLRPATRNFPLGLTFRPWAWPAVRNGEPGISDSVPVWPEIANTRMMGKKSSVAKRNWSLGLGVREKFPLDAAGRKWKSRHVGKVSSLWF